MVLYQLAPAVGLVSKDVVEQLTIINTIEIRTNRRMGPHFFIRMIIGFVGGEGYDMRHVLINNELISLESKTIAFSRQKM
jgi:hypothetical protein